MPSGKNWVNFIYVNLAFSVYILGTFYLSQIAKIKANWPVYRCNPMYMMLAPDIESNFVYCIQNMQTSFMGYLLQPLTFITSQASGIMGSFMNDINMIRAMFNKIRTFFSSIIQSVFGVFLNLIIEFQKITISIKYLIGKTIIKQNLETPILDAGMNRVLHKNKIYAFIKGIIDAGIKINCEKEFFPEESRI
jgi:hypothetical protein